MNLAPENQYTVRTPAAASALSGTVRRAGSEARKEYVSAARGEAIRGASPAVAGPDSSGGGSRRGTPA